MHRLFAVTDRLLVPDTHVRRLDLLTWRERYDAKLANRRITHLQSFRTGTAACDISRGYPCTGCTAPRHTTPAVPRAQPHLEWSRSRDIRCMAAQLVSSVRQHASRTGSTSSSYRTWSRLHRCNLTGRRLGRSVISEMLKGHACGYIICEHTPPKATRCGCDGGCPNDLLKSPFQHTDQEGYLHDVSGTRTTLIYFRRNAGEGCTFWKRFRRVDPESDKINCR